jgi:H+/Cl- antiporter ClcA
LDGVMSAASARLAGGIIIAGALSGGVGIALTLLLHWLQHISFGYSEATFLIGVQEASFGRRVGVLALAGAIAGFGWWAIRTCMGPSVGVTEAVQRADGRMPFWRSQADAVLQVVVVALGASLGREGAPRESAAATTSWLADRAGLTAEHRRLLVAGAGGAALAAVYGVPLAGTLFTLEVLLVSVAPIAVLVAVATSVIAVTIAWTVLPSTPLYHLPPGPASSSVFVFAALGGPLFGLAGLGTARLFRWAKRARPRGAWLVAATVTSFTLIGVAAIAYPHLLGNGKGALEVAVTGNDGWFFLLTLALLKPLATAMILRAGAAGGVLTPTLATGALIGAGLAAVWNDAWSFGGRAGLGATALVGAAAVYAVAGRAPATAVALTWELAHPPVWVVAAVALSVATAVLTTHPWRSRMDESGWPFGRGLQVAKSRDRDVGAPPGDNVRATMDSCRPG